MQTCNRAAALVRKVAEGKKDRQSQMVGRKPVTSDVRNDVKSLYAYRLPVHF